MPNFEVIITDVTTYGALYCVAGWDTHRGTMVRPEPPGANAANEPSRFWNGDWAGPGKFFDVGNVVQFEAAPPPGNFEFPHATEDCIWIGPLHPEPIRKLDAVQLSEAVPVSPSLNDAFGGGLVHARSGKAYVPKDFFGSSLGALSVAPSNLKLYESTNDKGARKLRAILADGGANYDLAVTADAARTRWLDVGLNAFQAEIAACNEIHVRVGLSRPFWGRPDECYAQINGIYYL